MPNRGGDNRLDEKNTKEKLLKDFGTHSPEFSDKGKIEETSLLKKNVEKDITKESDATKIFLKQLDNYRHSLNLSSNSIDDIPNTNIDLNKDLYRFSGMQCMRMNNIKLFEFSAGKIVTNDNLFCVEILNIDNNLKLGKWVMPSSTDMEDILLEFPLNKHTNLKSFVKCCKRHVNCYNYRQEQYNNLKNILSNAVNCSLDANLGFTRIHLHMSGIELIDSKEIYNIILFMAYKSNEAIPYLISIETQDDTLPPKMNNIFHKYFKPFKIVNLRAAFEQIIGDNRYFIWKKVSKVSDNFDEYITEEKDKESTPREMKSNDTKKINSESSLEKDLTELQIENENNRYSSNSMEDKEAKSKSNKGRNKNKLVEENLDIIVKPQKINKQKKDIQKSSTGTIKKKKGKEKTSVSEKKVQATLNDIFTKNNVDQSTKNKENKSPSITKNPVKNLRSRRTRTNDTNKNKSQTTLNKMFDKTNVETIECETNKSDKKINLPVKSTETTLLKNDEETSNITKISLNENPYKYFSSTPIVDKRKKKLDDVRLPEISAIASLSTNIESKKDLTNILNKSNEDSLSTINHDSENEEFNEMQAKELLRDIEVASKTKKEQDSKKNNTRRKTNKRRSVKKQQNKKGN